MSSYNCTQEQLTKLHELGFPTGPTEVPLYEALIFLQKEFHIFISICRMSEPTPEYYFQLYLEFDKYPVMNMAMHETPEAALSNAITHYLERYVGLSKQPEVDLSDCKFVSPDKF